MVRFKDQLGRAFAKANLVSIHGWCASRPYLLEAYAVFQSYF